MKKVSRLAKVSLGLAILGMVFVPTGAPFFIVTAFFLGLVAAITGLVGLLTIRRAPALLGGKRRAITGLCLGCGIVLLSPLVFIASMMRQWQHQHQNPEWEDMRSARVMSDEPLTRFTSNLPLIILDTEGRSIHKHQDTVARTRICAVENGRASIGGKLNYDGLTTIHYRGFSSMRLPKRSYTLHTVDQNTNQVEVPLLGLAKDEDWVLYAPFEDKTLMRDVLAYELAAKMGRYAPRTKFVELFVKSSRGPLTMRDYAGVYVLVEKIKRGKNRVNIQKLEPGHNADPEVTGGYIVKRDHDDDEGERFHTQHGGPYFYVYPKAEDITAPQRDWLMNYLNAFEAALHGPDFQDPENGYAAFLDVDSFIDAFWLVEASKNVDGFRYSAFLIKDRGGKLKVEPPWDWNRSFGNANYYGGGEVRGWYHPRLRAREISWYRQLSRDPAFMRRCQERWWELRRDVFEPQKIQARVEAMAAELEEAQKRNYQRWPIMGQHVTCNYYVGDSFADEVRWMKDWIAGRIAWIDSQMRVDKPQESNPVTADLER